jgi:hypothetical protein
MIDERTMAVNRPQFGIDCHIGLVSLATAIAHLTRLTLHGAIVVHLAQLVELVAPESREATCHQNSSSKDVDSSI